MLICTECKHYSCSGFFLARKEIKVKFEYIKVLSVHYYNVYNNLPEMQKRYKDSIDLMGNILLKDENIKKHLPEFDYISKHELIDIFSDYCADLGISVFNTEELMEYSLDLYLTKKTPLLKTEAVIIKTGHELTDSTYQEALNLIEKATSIASWLIFVTTHAGAYKIVLDKLIFIIVQFRINCGNFTQNTHPILYDFHLNLPKMI